MMKNLICGALMIVFPVGAFCSPGAWEKKGGYYFLTKTDRGNFSAIAAGANKFSTKYTAYNGVDFLVRGADDWRDYGRIDLEGDRMFAVPIRPGMKVDAVHMLIDGNIGNRYEHDKLLHLYGDNYYYGVLTALFAYEDGVYEALSVPVFWDWFHLGSGEWSQGGAKIISLGNSPVRKDCSMYHVVFTNPRPAVAVKDILLSDSWLGDKPFSEIFALTLVSADALEAMPREDREYKDVVKNVAQESPDKRTFWAFDKDLDGWIPGCSPNWGNDAFRQADAFGQKGVAVIPACNWAGDKFSWIEKKVSLPVWDTIQLRFLRHSAVHSEHASLWTDGLLKVLVKSASGQETVYEKAYSGEWASQTIDLSRYKGQTIVIRFENHGGGTVRLSKTTSPLCDGEDAIIDEIRIQKN